MCSHKNEGHQGIEKAVPESASSRTTFMSSSVTSPMPGICERIARMVSRSANPVPAGSNTLNASAAGSKFCAQGQTTTVLVNKGTCQQGHAPGARESVSEAA